MAQPQFTGQTYGEATAQERRTRTMPTGAAPTDVTPPKPGAVASLTAPTARPQEPITSGAPFGPGASPMQAGIPMMAEPQIGSRDYLIERVRGLYMSHPNPNLYALMVALESE